MPRRIRDAKLRNGRPTRQQQLEKFLSIKDFDDKCFTCDKWTLYGKTCEGVCDKE